MEKSRGEHLLEAASVAGGLFCVGGMALRAFGLKLGSFGAKGVVLGSMLALLGLALWMLRREGYRGRDWTSLLLPVAGAMLLRMCLLDYQSGDYLDFLSHWATFFREHEGFSALAMDVGDYNVPYLYFIAAMSGLNIPDLYGYKLFSIFFDVVLAWGGLRLVRVLRGEQGGKCLPAVAFLGMLWLPTVVLNGSLWGQCDAIYGALLVHGVALALEGRTGWSVVLAAVAFSFKLQTVFLLPLWGVLWLGKRIRFRELWLFPLTYLLTIVPALCLGKPLGDILKVYWEQMGQYPRLSLNAPSVFQWIPYGVPVQEGLAARLGIGSAALLVLALLLVGLRWGERMDGRAYMAVAVVLAIGVPFLLPHMHERYFFLADVLTLCWACVGWRRSGVLVLTAGASLASYAVYLRLKYNLVLSLFGARFVMGLEAAAMFGALLWAVLLMIRDIKLCKANLLNGREML